jgi:hypothetical protein
MDPRVEGLIAARSLDHHHRPRQVMVVCTFPCTGTMPARASRVIAARPMGQSSASWATVGLGRMLQLAMLGPLLPKPCSPCGLGHKAGFNPFAMGSIFNSFPFPRIDSNFGNSYLFEYLPKIHETSSIGFINSSSIHEKYQTK